MSDGDDVLRAVFKLAQREPEFDDERAEQRDDYEQHGVARIHYATAPCTCVESFPDTNVQAFPFFRTA